MHSLSSIISLFSEQVSLPAWKELSTTDNTQERVEYDRHHLTMFRALFGKSTSVITPEEFKAVEDQLNSKVRLLEETSRQLEQSKRQCREITEKLKISQQKQDSMTTEIASLQQQLRVAKQENQSTGKLLTEQTAKNNNTNTTKDNNKELWEQLKTVLIRPSSLVD